MGVSNTLPELGRVHYCDGPYKPQKWSGPDPRSGSKSTPLPPVTAGPVPFRQQIEDRLSESADRCDLLLLFLIENVVDLLLDPAALIFVLENVADRSRRPAVQQNHSDVKVSRPMCTWFLWSRPRSHSSRSRPQSWPRSRWFWSWSHTPWSRSPANCLMVSLTSLTEPTQQQTSLQFGRRPTFSNDVIK